jgi:aminopeptidase N
MSQIRFRAERCCHHVPADPGLGPRPFRLPGDPERYGRPRPYDIGHLRLDIALDVRARTFRATATLAVMQRDPAAKTLVLDGVGFDVKSVRRVDRTPTPLEHRYDGDQFHIALGPLSPGERASIAIEYTAEPKRGLYFLYPKERRPDLPYQVWSQCQDEDAKHWIPCHDFPNMRMSTEFIVTAPEGWTVISNGRLVSRESVSGHHDENFAQIGATGPGLEKWHWLQEQPHASYLVTLVAGRFSETIADLPDLSVRYFVDPGREADGNRTFARTPEMIEHFSRLHGVPFPWAKYHQVVVHNFIFGGMENTSATTMTDRILIDERAAIDNTSDDIVAHELAHQWFGDLVTCRDWSHAWLNEGFATYYEHLDWEKKAGRDEYLWSLKEHADGYFGEDDGRYRRPIVCTTFAHPIDLFDRHLYEKGGWVLHMLRCDLGDSLFFGGVHRYLEKHRGGIVETRDLMRAMEDVSGRSLEGFFDQWVFRAGYPDLEVDATHDDERNLLTFSVKQKQTVDAVTPLFKFKLAVAVHTAKGEERHVLDVSEASQAFTLRVAGPPRWIAVDPDDAILSRIAQKFRREWLLDALANDPRSNVRWRAAEALGRRDEAKVVAALVHSVKHDSFWAVSALAARALGEMRSDRAYEALAALVAVKHPKVRRSVIAALGEYRTEKSARLLVALLEKGDESVLVESEMARSAGRTRQPLVFDALVAAMQRTSWRDLVRLGAVDGLARLRDDRAIKLIDPLADDQPHLGTRRAAVLALAEFSDHKRTVRERLEVLLDPNDPYFTPEVSRALTRLRDADAVGALSRLLRHSLDGRVQRHAREAIRDLQKHESPDEMRRLNDALDRLRDEHQTLRDELSRVKSVLRLDGDNGGDGSSKPSSAPKSRSKKALGAGRGGRKKSRVVPRSKRGRS